MKKKLIFFFIDGYLLDCSGQKSLALNDYDARLMKTKDKGQKYPKFSYNVQ